MGQLPNADCSASAATETSMISGLSATETPGRCLCRPWPASLSEHQRCRPPSPNQPVFSPSMMIVLPPPAGC